MGTFFNYEKLKKGLTGAVTVAAGAVSQGLEVAKNLADDLTSFKALKDYKLAGACRPRQGAAATVLYQHTVGFSIVSLSVREQH